MIYAIFDGEFVEVKSMYKKSNGGPTYYSIWVVGSDGEYYAKNYDSEELRDKVWDKIIGKLVHNARPSCDTEPPTQNFSKTTVFTPFAKTPTLANFIGSMFFRILLTRNLSQKPLALTKPVPLSKNASFQFRVTIIGQSASTNSSQLLGLLVPILTKAANTTYIRSSRRTSNRSSMFSYLCSGKANAALQAPRSTRKPLTFQLSIRTKFLLGKEEVIHVVRSSKKQMRRMCPSQYLQMGRYFCKKFRIYQRFRRRNSSVSAYSFSFV